MKQMDTKTFIKKQIEELAKMVKSGFDHTEERFSEAEKNINQLRDEADSRFNKVDGRLHHIEITLCHFV